MKLLSSLLALSSLATISNAGVLSSALVSQSTSRTPYPSSDSSYSATTNASETSGLIIQDGSTTAANQSVSGALYQTAAYQFGFTTTSNETPPTTIYFHYSGSTISYAQEPGGSFAFYGGKVDGSSSIFASSSADAWNAGARYGVVESGTHLSAATDQHVPVASSAFNGWTLVTSGTNLKIYKSTGTYTIMTPTASCGGNLGYPCSYLSHAQWEYTYLWLQY